MTASVCPSRDELERLLDERLGPDDQQRVGGHVAGCAACQKTLEALTADAAPDLPSWPGRTPDEVTPLPTGLLDRLKQSPPAAGAAPPADDAAEPPPELNDYEILSVLGRGGEGVVYRARHRPLGRLVALKVLRGDGPGQPQALRRFQMEAETLARLRHPNIVQVYEVGAAAGRPFFAMEYVEGGALAARLKGQPQPAREAAALLEVLARAVHAAHQAGVVHRDLKPGNVLLNEDGTPKVSDFGLAKRVQADASLTRTGTVLGTPAYMAPEQARAEGKDVGPACDIYALGSILYHLLTGRPPFVGERTMDVLLQVVQDEPVSVRRLVPRAPRDLETICLKCLHKDPRRRYASAEALADDLRRWLDGRPVLARPTPAWERAWKAARRRPVIATLAAACSVALLLLLGGGAYYNARLSAALHDADDNARRAAAREADARAAEKNASDEAAEAKRQQALSLEAYHNLVFDVQDSMGRQPGLIGLRKKLLQTAVAGLKKVGRGERSTGRDRAQAEAHYRLAMAFAEADDLDDARPEFEASRAVADELLAAGPGDADIRDLLCRIESGFGNTFKRLGRNDEAVAAFGKEADQARAWLAADPHAAGARDRLGEACDWAAGVEAEAKKPDEAKEWNRRLEAAAAEWLKDDPKSSRARYYLSAAEDRRGRLLEAAGDLPAARDAYGKARGLLDEALAAEPADETYANSSRILDGDYGRALFQMGDSAGALPHFQKVADTYWDRRRAGAFEPQNFEAELQMAQGFTDCGIAHQALFRFEDAITWYGRAVETLLPFQGRPPSPDAAQVVQQRLGELQARGVYCKAALLVIEDPSIAGRVQPVSDAQALLVLRACYFMSQGRADDANRAADVVDAIRPRNADEFYTLAVSCANGAVRVNPARAPDGYDDAEKALRKRLVDKALASLDQAAAAGFKDPEKLKGESALAVLRGEPRFQALLKRLQQSP